MFWISNSLIVVAATTNPYRENLSWTTPTLMDPEGKGIDGKLPGSSQSESTAFKSKVKNILPTVHSAVAAASPLFNSYRSVFQNWKHSVPKLYKYPSSDIEVVVYRKNGEVEKLSNQKNGLIDEDKLNVGEECDPGKDPTKELSFQQIEEGRDKSDDILSSLKLAIDVNENDCEKITEELKFVPLDESVPQVGHETDLADVSVKDEVGRLCSRYSNTTKVDEIVLNPNVPKQNCEYIFNRKCKVLSVPSSNPSVQVQTSSVTIETRSISVNTLPTTAEKNAQVCNADFPPVTKSDFVSQCNLVPAGPEKASKFMQTDDNILPETSEFTQIFPVTLETANQTSVTTAFGNSSAQTVFGTVKDAGTQTEREARIPQVHSVQWHGNVPGCNVNTQTETLLVKNESTQAFPVVVSTFSQVENDLQATKDIGVSTNPQVAHVGVQLSASCCYFARKKERKLFEKKLDAARNEIICFYESKCLKAASTNDREKEEVEEKVESEVSLSESNEVTKSNERIEEAKKQLNLLETEVEHLIENSIQLKTSLESMENTSYFEDSWIQSDC